MFSKFTSSLCGMSAGGASRMYGFSFSLSSLRQPLASRPTQPDASRRHEHGHRRRRSWARRMAALSVASRSSRSPDAVSSEQSLSAGSSAALPSRACAAPSWRSSPPSRAASSSSCSRPASPHPCPGIPGKPPIPGMPGKPPIPGMPGKPPIPGIPGNPPIRRRILRCFRRFFAIANVLHARGSSRACRGSGPSPSIICFMKRNFCTSSCTAVSGCPEPFAMRVDARRLADERVGVACARTS